MSFELSAVEKDSPIWTNLYALFRVTDPENLGYGRDVRASGHYTGLTPVCAWSIEAPNRFDKYVAAVSEVQDALDSADLEMPELKTKLDTVAEDLFDDGLNDSVNEKLLLHGTRPETLLTLMQNGLSERFSGGLFGSGSYLAEDPSKIDQYCVPDAQNDDQRLLHEKLFEECDIKPVKDMLYAIVCRVALGYPVYTKDGETNLNPPHDKIFARDDKRELALIPSDAEDKLPIHYHSLIVEVGKPSEGYKCARHREFVVFDASRIMEEYIIGYIRDMAPEQPSFVLPNVLPQSNGNQDLRDAAVEAEGGGAPPAIRPAAHVPTKLFPIGGISKAAGIAIAPCGKFALVGTDDDEQPRLARIDLETGKMTFPYGDFQSPPFSVAIAPDSSFALVTDRPNDQILRIDLITGLVQRDYASVSTGNQVAISPCGGFALVASEDKQIAFVQLKDASAGVVTCEEIDVSPQGIAIDPSGKFALISHERERGRGGILRYDLKDKSVTDLHEDSRLECCNHITIAPSGAFALVGASPCHARIDLRTEEIAFVDSYSDDGLDVQNPLCVCIAPSETFALTTCEDTGKVSCINSGMACWKPAPVADDVAPSKRCCTLL